MHDDAQDAFSQISPEELTMLRRVFSGVCRLRGWAPDSPPAVADAARIINLFQHGVRSEVKLTHMLIGDAETLAS